MATNQIEAIPLTPNGKVDKRKLPEPVFLRKTESVRVMNHKDSTRVVEMIGVDNEYTTQALLPEEILILFRDNGKTLSSAEPEEDSTEFTNLKMIHSIAKKVDYSRILGLNSTVVTLARVNE